MENVFLVIGMHKSGTTLIAQTLQRSGVNMGWDIDEEKEEYGGNQCESPEVNAINNTILGTEGKNSLEIVPPFEWNQGEEVKGQARVFLQKQQETGEKWGFKDPRTIFAYPVWKKVLPEHRLIGVFRDLYGVLRHYLGGKRGKKARRRTIVQAWVAYNRALLEVMKNTPQEDRLLLNYDAFLDSPEPMEQLKTFTGVELTDQRDLGMRKPGWKPWQQWGLLTREEKRVCREVMGELWRINSKQ